MATQSSHLSLTTRLVDRYLMIGLACLLASVVASIVLSSRGAFTELVSATALLPLSFLLVGGYYLKRTVRLSAAIEEQLAQVACISGGADMVLRPLDVEHPAAAGWNQLLERIRENASLASIDQRLSASIDGVQQRKWVSLFNSLPDGIAVSDGSGRIQFANSLLAGILGVEAAALQGRTMPDLLEPLAPTGNREALARLSSSRGATICELQRGAALAEGVLRVGKLPLLEESFDAGSALWSVRDITQQKLAEDARNQFVFTATHELRTPLANIKAYAETLSMQDDIDFEQQKGFYNIINAEATRLARFVDDLLNVSQMEAGGLTLTAHEIDLGRLLAEVVEHVSPQARLKQITFETTLPPKLPVVRADKDKLSAALVNLLGNGIKYTPPGGDVRLIVEGSPTSVEFHVEDTGIGIAPEELPRLCEKFFRSQDSRVQGITGSGLGLAFAQEVARLHGGRITVQSELNQGSRFSMSLPI